MSLVGTTRHTLTRPKGLAVAAAAVTAAGAHFRSSSHLNPRWDVARDGGALRCGAPIAPAEQRRRAAPDADGRGTWDDLERGGTQGGAGGGMVGGAGGGTGSNGGAAAAAAPVDVPPEAGTFVKFRSEAIPHEARPTCTERQALVVGWFHRSYKPRWKKW